MDINDLTNASFLWASLIWSGIASGYLLYGWRQKAYVPLATGAVMTAVSWLLPAFWMSLVCIAAMAAAWWLHKQGY